MERCRRADAVVFGFDFQVNSAIVIFLENVKDVKSLRLEGNYEDIEIELNDGQYILAQAKSVERASSDFRNVRKNMKKAILSLAEGNQKVKAKELIMVTNSPDPFNDKKSKSVFYGHSHRGYDTLPDSAKNIIDKYLKTVSAPFETDKFMIHVIPFETDYFDERYKVIMESINNFVGSINPDIPGLGRKLLDVWHWQVFDNGGKHNSEIKLDKKDIIWPVLVKIIEEFRGDEDFFEMFDRSIYDEFRNRYSETIENHCERCEFFIRVLSEYNSYKSTNLKDRLNDFINDKWQSFVDEFSSEEIDDEIKEAITKIVMYRIVKRKYAINRVKEVTNL